MKHDLRIVLVLILFFILAQLVGLSIINYNVITEVEGVPTVGYNETALGEIPAVSGETSLLYVVAGVAIGTVLLLFIIRLKKVSIWKIWFFLAVFIAIALGLGAVIDYELALLLALVLAVLKILKPNVFIHNITELLMYAGISFFIVGLFKDRVLWIAILLILISIYDIFAVFKSKHMVKMAKFQTKSRVFAGLCIPYVPKSEKGRLKKAGLKAEKRVKPPQPPIKESESSQPPKGLEGPASKLSQKRLAKKNAILGGGDIAFPLIFSGVVMHQLVQKFLDSGMAAELARSTALLQTLIITLTTTIAVGLLFFFAKKDKFYPAMPFITTGCFLGYLIVLIL